MEQLPKDKKANPKCKDCFGRGYIKWVDPEDNKKRNEKLCHCVKIKQPSKEEA